MILMDPTSLNPLADRDNVSAAELSARLPATVVTRVPQGPTGLWEALAAAARRRRAETADLDASHVVDVTDCTAEVHRSAEHTAINILDSLGVDVVPLPG